MPSKQRVLLGAFLFGGFLLFAVGLFLIGDRRLLFTESFEIHTEFAKLAGLQIGSLVRVAGMEAGEVLDITVPPGPESRFRVRFRVQQKLHPIVRTDSVATIQTEGVLGNKFLQISAGTGDAPRVAPGGTIPSREAVEFGDLLEQINSTIALVNESILEVRDEVQVTLRQISGVTGSVNQMVAASRDDVRRIIASIDRIMRDSSEIVESVRAGRGTVGRLITDDALYQRIRGTAENIEKTAGNLQETTQNVSEIVADVKRREVIKEVEETARNLRVLTGRLNTAVEKFTGRESGAPGAVEDIRVTLANVRDATAGLADNMEALKRNWFFRGFYNRRGFFDLRDVTLAEYQAGDFAPKYERSRVWIHINDLFAREPDGADALTEAGKAQINTAMSQFVPVLGEGFLIIEVYSAEGDAALRYINAQRRGELARRYIIEQFQLRPNYVGVMPMGAVPSKEVLGTGKPVTGKYWEGLALVWHYRP